VDSADHTALSQRLGLNDRGNILRLPGIDFVDDTTPSTEDIRPAKSELEARDPRGGAKATCSANEADGNTYLAAATTLLEFGGRFA
jgi:hypothetical protein